MKKYSLILMLLLAVSVSVFAQRRVSELMLSYDMKVTSGNAEPGLADAFDGATTTVYIKGNLTRSEMTSALFSSTTIHDSKAGTAVALKEVSKQKLLIKMTPENWAEKNKRYDGITFTNTTETKTIAGYKCVKAQAKLTDGTVFTVFYTTDIVPENREFENMMFKNLNGLPLEWELSEGKLKIQYTLSKISMNPIPVSKFDIPKSGYRELTYYESKKAGSN
jgi:GLPGLI family protein